MDTETRGKACVCMVLSVGTGESCAGFGVVVQEFGWDRARFFDRHSVRMVIHFRDDTKGFCDLSDRVACVFPVSCYSSVARFSR